MSEKASYFKLGVFVIIGTALALTGVGVLGAGALFKKTIKAETYMVESVQGLDVGAPVKHRGVQVGKVSRIAFLGEEYELPLREQGKLNLLTSYVYVEMELSVSRRGKNRTIETFKSGVRSGMCARLASTGLVGNVYVDLYFPSEPPKPIELTWEPRSLYIPSTKSVIAELTATISNVARQLEEAKIDHVVKNVDTLVQKFGQKVEAIDVAGMQHDIRALIAEVRESNSRVQKVLANPDVEGTLNNLAAASASLRRITGEGEGDLGTFIKDLPEVSARLKSSAEEIESILKDEKTRRTLDKLATTADLAPEAAAEIRRVAQRLGTLLSSQQADLEAIVREMRKASENLERFSAEAARNPSRVIFGEPPSAVRPGKEEEKK